MTDGPGQRHDPASHEAGPRRRPFAMLFALAIFAALAFAGFAALGTWQLYRLQWKLALIERVDQRVHAAPVPPPGPERWPAITAESDEYRHVRVTGKFLYDRSTKVQASTELGSGYWLLTPLRRADGSTVLINRGFIRAGVNDPMQHAALPPAASTVSGLLRISEPGGGFLRNNDPAAERWYSRDVQAIAATRGLSQVAPYFIDADAGQDPADNSADAPVGGLTVIAFHNNHLVYALTWYALALMVAGACLLVVRDERKRRESQQPRLGAGSGTDGIGETGDDGQKQSGNCGHN